MYGFREYVDAKYDGALLAYHGCMYPNIFTTVKTLGIEEDLR